MQLLQEPLRGILLRDPSTQKLMLYLERVHSLLQTTVAKVEL